MGSQDEEEHALKGSTRAVFGGLGRGRGSYRGRGQGRGKGQGRQGIDKAMIECYRCHKLGPFQWECWSGKANYVENQEEMLLMAIVEKSIEKIHGFLIPATVIICAERKNFSSILMKLL